MLIRKNVSQYAYSQIYCQGIRQQKKVAKMSILYLENLESCRRVWEYSSWNDVMKTTKMRIFFFQNEIDMLTRIGTDSIKNDTYQFLLRLKV